MQVSALIGIGSNLETPLKQVELACEVMSSHPQMTLVKQSPWYGSEAVGPGRQPDYVNGAIEIRTNLDATALLEALQSIETQHGRIRSERWGARTLDLDLLWYNGEIIDLPQLQVPHPRINERNFVLFPLRDIAPRCVIESHQTVEMLAEHVSATGIWRL